MTLLKLKNCARMALAASFLIALSGALSRAEEKSDAVPLNPTPLTEFPEAEVIPDAAELSRLLSPEVRKIGGLDWHIDYSEAYRQARDEKKMLLLVFRDEANPRIADIYERDVLASDELKEPLAKVVRVVLPLDVRRPVSDADSPGKKMLEDNSFQYMYGRQGIAMIDLTEPKSELHGRVVSAHPFSNGRLYTARGTKIILGLPRGTVTQRALIYAVRLHPYAPISTTAGQCHGYLCKQAHQSSHLMMTYGSVGHHDWGNRYSEIAATTGKSAMEVAAMSGNRSLIDAAIEVVDQWYGSPAHWQIMSSPASIFGYDLVHDSAGNWWGTGLFAN
ncbi:MAG TPA: hypothetical protein VL475_02525 [Planctomycetaceae bacterium]|jgi:hypothetical protein|nr:hypothetical protein [Planctomycetaceae bacterium]